MSSFMSSCCVYNNIISAHFCYDFPQDPRFCPAILLQAQHIILSRFGCNLSSLDLYRLQNKYGKRIGIFREGPQPSIGGAAAAAAAATAATAGVALGGACASVTVLVVGVAVLMSAQRCGDNGRLWN